MKIHAEALLKGGAELVQNVPLTTSTLTERLGLFANLKNGPTTVRAHFNEREIAIIRARSLKPAVVVILMEEKTPLNASMPLPRAVRVWPLAKKDFLMAVRLREAAVQDYDPPHCDESVREGEAKTRASDLLLAEELHVTKSIPGAAGRNEWTYQQWLAEPIWSCLKEPLHFADLLLSRVSSTALLRYASAANLTASWLATLRLISCAEVFAILVARCWWLGVVVGRCCWCGV